MTHTVLNFTNLILQITTQVVKHKVKRGRVIEKGEQRGEIGDF